MPIFSAEIPRANTYYRSPEETPVQRTETPIKPTELSPALRQALGETRVAALYAVEVRGGSWCHFGPDSRTLSSAEGAYSTVDTNKLGLKETTIYTIGAEGQLTISTFCFDLCTTMRRLDLSDVKEPTIKVNLNKTSSILDLLGSKFKPFGLGATITLERVEGTDQTQPVLRYTEVRPSFPITHLSLRNPSNYPKENLLSPSSLRLDPYLRDNEPIKIIQKNRFKLNER